MRNIAAPPPSCDFLLLWNRYPRNLPIKRVSRTMRWLKFYIIFITPTPAKWNYCGCESAFIIFYSYRALVAPLVRRSLFPYIISRLSAANFCVEKKNYMNYPMPWKVPPVRRKRGSRRLLPLW